MAEPRLGTQDRPLNIAVVGAGPAGFYAAEALLKSDLNVQVDLIERLPAPYGLVRYGVAPDHQKIKHVIGLFDKVAALPGFRYVGNVQVGVDASTDDLFEHYHQVVFTIGSAGGREMGVDGEHLDGSHSAVDFVGWYNAHPDYSEEMFRLDTERAVVIGAGNVAADLTRVLLRDRDELAKSDIADVALEALRQSPIKEVVVLVRRGPVEMKMALHELEEIDGLSGVEVVADKEQVDAAVEAASELSPLERKELEFFEMVANRPRRGEPRAAHFRFYASTKEIVGVNGRVTKLVAQKNALLRRQDGVASTRYTAVLEEFETGLVLEAIGYRGVAVPGLPFDDRRGVIPNKEGRVMSDGRALVGSYVSGWIKRGPEGLIGANRADSVQTVESMLADVAAGQVGEPMGDPDDLLERLRRNGVRLVDFDDWRRLDALELEAGAAEGHLRKKFPSVEEMLTALDEEPTKA